MRAGGITVQQTLTTEAASVLKHSLTLARRRGHAQVTPLHVAATLLSSRASLLKRACLKSQPHQSSHPLHSRALELCFNVALNRLPTSPAPLLHGQPSLSNALIAALKRAQAHQRRGCIEQQQQQPLLAIKVELEQLILSILDDPSVSRVMREAGFSSTSVKNNLEDSSASPLFQCYNSSGGVYSSPCSPSQTETIHREVINIINPSSFWQHTHVLNYSSEQNPLFFSPLKKVPSINSPTVSDSLKEDIKLVLEVFLRKKRRNTVIVGDSASVTEGLVAELMSRIGKGLDDISVPEEIKSAHFIKFQFSSVPLRFMRREEVEMNLSDLKRKVDSLSSGGRGVIIYTGDLKWTVDHTSYGNGERERESGKYSPVDHLVAEIGRLMWEYSSSNTKIWLMATANYQTYMRCQMRQPSLEIQWALQAVSVPSGGLGLSLNATSPQGSRVTFSQDPSQVLEKKPFISKEEQDMLTCCAECTSNYEKEAALSKSGHQANTKNTENKSNQLPSWLLSNGSESIQKDNLAELRRKWNRLCHSLHQARHIQNHVDSSLLNNQFLTGKNYSYTSSYPWWPKQNNISSDTTNSISFADSTLKINRSASSVPRFRRQQSCHIEFSFGDGIRKLHQLEEPNLDSLKRGSEGKEVKITLALGNNSLDSRKSERLTQDEDICKLLQENVPWQSERIPSIVQILMEIKRETTWLLIDGNDSIGKRRLAFAIAQTMFGSADFLLSMNMRKRENKFSQCSETLERALKNQEKLVVLVEDVELADSKLINYLCDGFKTGKFGESGLKERGSETLFILTKGDPSHYLDNAKKSTSSVIQMKLEFNATSPRYDQKRKAECEFLCKTKTARISEKEEQEEGNIKKDLSRQSSSNTLDLNIMADYDDERENNPGGENSPIKSDVTLETANDYKNPLAFLESIENRATFDQNSGQERRMKEMFLSKIKSSFEEVHDNEAAMGGGCELYVEEMVLEEVVVGSGSFLNSLFDKWLKDIFQTSLQAVKTGGKEGISLRLCLGGKENGQEEDGFMGSNLPKKIQVSFMP